MAKFIAIKAPGILISETPSYGLCYDIGMMLLKVNICHLSYPSVYWGTRAFNGPSTFLYSVFAFSYAKIGFNACLALGSDMALFIQLNPICRNSVKASEGP